MAFNDIKKEYLIENMYPEKRPLMNYLWNEEYIAVINQFGFGKGRYSSDNNFQYEIIKDCESRILYIKENGKVFSPNRNFDREAFETFNTIVGMGYSTVVSDYMGYHTEFTMLVPQNGKCECWRVEIKNTSNEKKSFDLYAYADFDINFSGHISCTYGDFDKDLNGIYYNHVINDMKTSYTTGFLSTSEEVYSYDTAKRRFVGHYGSLRCPDAMANDMLACKSNSFDYGTIAALQSKITLAPGEEKIIYMVAGAEKNVKSAAESAKKYLNDAAFNNEIAYLKAVSDKYDNNVSIKTPDEDINRFINIWLKRQLELGKTWGRVYNKGFRDIMQDIAGFLSLDHKISRERLLDCTQYQFEDGNTIRSWVPVDRWPYRDGAVWLLQTVVSYVKESGDLSVLDEMIPYMDTDKSGTLYEHLLKGADFLLDGTGKHGLCLWGGGDWNDSFDGAGLQNKGESVWLSIATVKGVNDLLELFTFMGKDELVKKYTDKKNVLTENIQKYGYDVDHYIYGYNDWDERVGSYDTDEARVFLNPQTWSVLAGVAKDNDAILDIVEKELTCDYGYVQQSPAYSNANPNTHVGRIAYFGKGFYENGSVYNHGVAFKIVADCVARRGEYAYQTVKKMLPTNPKNTSEMSGMEPYAISNMYFGPENDSRAGEAPMHWITGTSSWLFRGVVEYIIGVRADFDGLVVDPQLPSCWDKVEIKRTYRNAVYNITIERTGNKSITADGVEYAEKLPIFNDGKEHSVVVTF